MKIVSRKSLRKVDQAALQPEVRLSENPLHPILDDKYPQFWLCLINNLPLSYDHWLFDKLTKTMKPLKMKVFHTRLWWYQFWCQIQLIIFTWIVTNSDTENGTYKCGN